MAAPLSLRPSEFRRRVFLRRPDVSDNIQPLSCFPLAFTRFVFGMLCDSEHEGDTFLRNVGLSQASTAVPLSGALDWKFVDV
jgi:hypothetical protein